MGGITPLVGREGEIALLLERWTEAKDGEGQVVLLSGEPGIGKSRITQALQAQIAAESHTRLRYQCSPYYTNTAFYPIIDQLERAAGYVRDATPDSKLDLLEALLRQGTRNVADAAPIVAALMSLPVDRYPSLNFSGQLLKERIIEVLTEQTAGLAEQKPVLMIFEDAHWADPASLELLSEVIDRIRMLRVLLVVTFRPEFESPWGSYDHVTLLSLNRLSRRHGARIVELVTGGKSLPDEVLDQIITKTDGVPLFVEELTKTVLEAEVAASGQSRTVADLTAVIFAEDDKEKIFYVLADGSVSVKINGVETGEINAGECFGETEYLSDTGRTAAVTANGETVAIVVERDFKEWASLPYQLRLSRVFQEVLIARLKTTSKALARASN
jgi:predicted ATPase